MKWTKPSFGALFVFLIKWFLSKWVIPSFCQTCLHVTPTGDRDLIKSSYFKHFYRAMITRSNFRKSKLFFTKNFRRSKLAFFKRSKVLIKDVATKFFRRLKLFLSLLRHSISWTIVSISWKREFWSPEIRSFDPQTFYLNVGFVLIVAVASNLSVGIVINVTWKIGCLVSKKIVCSLLKTI